MRRVHPFLVILLLSLQLGCASTKGGSGGTNPPPPPGVTVSLSAASLDVRLGSADQVTATVSGSSNHNVSWFVAGVAGGNATVGTISASGKYTAPANMPNPGTAAIKAVSAADSSATATATLTLWNPTPTISSVSPQSFPVGSFTLTVNGGEFVSGAKILFGGVALTTTFVSAAKLTATGSASTAGTFAVSVSNPNPGGSSSASMNVQVTSNTPPPPPSACNVMTPGQGGSLNGFLPFPADNLWNKDISSAPLDANSTALINFIGGSVTIHADFGSGLYQGSSIGIPYIIVSSAQPLVNINFTDFGDESDPGPMPVPANAPIEGYPNPGNGDRHVLVLDNSNCWLYELYSASAGSGGAWNAGSAAVWDLQNDEQRPWTWTSADAAGLPIFPGLIRYDEVAAGQIKHAIRFTLQFSRAAMTPPASHMAATSSQAMAAPMGMRLRLKSNFDVSTFSATNQVILKAMKQFGMIMADNGSSMYISGAPDDRWDNDDLHSLGSVTASDFEVVQMNPIYTSSNVPTGSAPAIASFTATPSSASAGAPVTLNWSVTGASYFVISPTVGAIRGNSVQVNPAQTTTYTLAATNQFGRTNATVKVTVQ
ncbi:MAG: IPT/TIG domain-containing protein [Candidatus Acidiferrales bacterium]